MTDSSFRATRCCMTALLMLFALALPAWALPTINLTNSTYNTVASSTSGTITNALGTAIFARDNTMPTGTGVFNPFLRLDCQGNGCDEQGYNTNASKILDDKSPLNWTHDVKFSDLQVVAVSGVDYYQFMLDINEPGNGNSLLSLDGLKLFSTSQGGQSSQNVDSFGDASGIQGTTLWDMDLGKTPNGNKDNSVLLDATVSGGPGSGNADMVFLVKKADIDKNHTNAAEDKLILWSRFGLSQGAQANSCGLSVCGVTVADAGFEEWSYKAKSGTVVNCTTCGNGVPTPGTASLALLALGFLGRQQYRSRKAPIIGA